MLFLEGTRVPLGNGLRHALTTCALPSAIDCSNDSWMTLQAFNHFCTEAPSLGFPCPPAHYCPPSQVNTHSFCEDTHKFWELMCQESQHGCEGTQSSSEEDEEGELLLGVNWDFMESWGNQKGAIKTQVDAFLGTLTPLPWLQCAGNETGRTLDISQLTSAPLPLFPSCFFQTQVLPAALWCNRVSLWASHIHWHHLCLIYSVPFPKANTKQQNHVQITAHTLKGKPHIKCECAMHQGTPVPFLFSCVF